MRCITWFERHFLNLVLLLSSCLLIGVGVYLEVHDTDLYVKGIFGDQSYITQTWEGAVYLDLAVGVFSFLLFVTGCIGHCGSSQPNHTFVNVHTVLVIFCITLELTVVGLDIAFNQMINSDANGWQNYIKYDYQNPNATSPAYDTYHNQSNYDYTVNMVQSEWQCCGDTDYSDYWNSSFTLSTGLVVPYECCVRKAGTPTTDLNYYNVLNYSACQSEATVSSSSFYYLYSEGCFTKMHQLVNQQMILVISIEVILASLQVVGLMIYRRVHW